MTDPGSNAQEPGSSLRARARRVASMGIRFLLGQGAVQLIGILAGFYLVRALSVEAYAQFGFATSFQQLATLLMDFGLASTIVPLVGARAKDRAVVGSYIRAAQHLRNRSFLLLAPAALSIFVWIMHRHHWSAATETLLAVSVFASIYATAKISYFSVPLILDGRLTEMYLPQAGVGIARLALLGFLKGAGALTGPVAALSGTLSIIVSGRLLENKARPSLIWPEQNEPKVDREMLRYILPAVPVMVFSAFQVQSSVLLISMFSGTAAIAQVSALGRLNQIFAIFMTFNAVMIEPFMARQNREHFVSRYFAILGAAAFGCALLVALAFLFPHAFLWVLGSKYWQLQQIAGWAVLAGALNYIQVLLWVMNRSRKWVFWRGTVLEICLAVLAEAVFLVVHGVHTTADAVFFSIACTAGPLATHAYITWFGVRRDKRLAAPAVF